MKFRRANSLITFIFSVHILPVFRHVRQLIPGAAVNLRRGPFEYVGFRRKSARLA